jgi:hypothetical protein
MTTQRRSYSEKTFWLPSDVVQEAAKIAYQKYYVLNSKMRVEKIQMLRKIYKKGFVNKIFAKEQMNYFLNHPSDEIDGARFLRLLEVLPSEYVWAIDFAYSSWRPEINKAWNIYSKTLKNLDHPRILLTEEEIRFLEANSGVILLKG